jgi:rubrerythrin
MGKKKNHENNNNHENNSEFAELILTAIEDELAAAAMYATMATMVENRVLQSLMFNIAGEEFSHARTFMVIFQLLDCVDLV